jgi:hypothetical protein
MLTTTYQHLADRGFTRGQAQIDRVAIGAAIAKLLAESPVESEDLDEIQAKALIVAEIRNRVLGDSDDEEVERELDTIVSGLSGMNSVTQAKLDDGVVLCAARVSRKLTNDQGETVTIRRVGRFVTSIPALIDYWVPMRAKLLRDAEQLRDRIDLASRRVPALEQSGRELLGRARGEVEERLALTQEASA